MNAPIVIEGLSKDRPVCSKMIMAILTATIALVTFLPPASARICKRVCSGGVCWSDCSKLPGESSTRR